MHSKIVDLWLLTTSKIVASNSYNVFVVKTSPFTVSKLNLLQKLSCMGKKKLTKILLPLRNGSLKIACGLYGIQPK